MIVGKSAFLAKLKMLKTRQSLKKENAELRAQIEKLRNFENCDYQLHIVDCPIFKSGGHISCKKMSSLDFARGIRNQVQTYRCV